MNIFVLLKMVPDTVEELAIAGDGKSLDTGFLRYKASDSDEHAIEEALLLKEGYGGTVTVVGLDAPEVEEVLFTALAKGADKAVKLVGGEESPTGPSAAGVLAAYLRGPDGSVPPDTLILLRGQAIDELDGELSAWLAARLGLPFVGVVTGVALEGTALTVTKEFAGGLRGEFTLSLPAVLGIQSAERPPRYVPFAKVRATMKSATIESVEVAAPQTPATLAVTRMAEPEPSGHAEMIEGSPDDVADRLVTLLAEKSVL